MDKILLKNSLKTNLKVSAIRLIGYILIEYLKRHLSLSLGTIHICLWGGVVTCYDVNIRSNSNLKLAMKKSHYCVGRINKYRKSAVHVPSYCPDFIIIFEKNLHKRTWTGLKPKDWTMKWRKDRICRMGLVLFQLKLNKILKARF